MRACFKHQSARTLPSSSQLTGFCCDLTAKDQTKTETGTSGDGRVVKRGERSSEKAAEKKRKDKLVKGQNKKEVMLCPSYNLCTYRVKY